MDSTQLTLLQPELDILLAGVDGVHCLCTHIVEMGTQQAPLTEVYSDIQVQVLEAPYLFSLTHCPWIFLWGEEPLLPGLRRLPAHFPLITESDKPRLVVFRILGPSARWQSVKGHPAPTPTGRETDTQSIVKPF